MEIQLSFSRVYHSPIPLCKLKQFIHCKTKYVKPLKNPEFTPLLSIKSYAQPNPPQKSIKQSTLSVEKYHFAQSLTQKLTSGKLTPLQLLQDDGDWDKAQFWTVIQFLQQSSRNHEIPEVFNAWTKLDDSRVNELHYNKIIALLSEAGMMDEAALELESMKKFGLLLCSEVYNSVIHGYAVKGLFDDAIRYLKEMAEKNVNPDTETYDGLIKAYGKFQMYDEMVDCLKLMESRGCSPDHITYNLLIQELGQGRLLNRMERMYQTSRTKKMDTQTSTLVAMLEAYADFGVLEKMERFYIKVRNSKTILKEGLIRKIARVYVENYMFSRLEDLGYDVASRMGRTYLFWSLILLSHACLLSKKGLNSVIQHMEEAGVSWSPTITNIISLAYLKMKDFKQLSMTFSELPHRHVQPDIVTFGILYDAYNIGFDGSSTLKMWRKYGYLENDVELNTDPLVFTAFGKGLFLRTVEEMYFLLEPNIREQKRWTYDGLVDLVLKQHGT